MEAGVFDERGQRTQRAAGAVSTNANAKPIPADQVKIRDFTYAERGQMKHVVFIKPYLEGIDNQGTTRGDYARIIGTASSNAGKYERLDIKIGRMSM